MSEESNKNGKERKMEKKGLSKMRVHVKRPTVYPPTFVLSVCGTYE